MSNRQIDRLVVSGDWLRVHPGVFRICTAVPTPEAILRAASLWLGGGCALAGTGAGWWWGVAPDPPSGWHFMSPSSHPPARSGVRVSRSFVDPRDLTVRLGVPVVSRPLALLQAAVEAEGGRPGAGIVLIDRSKQRRVVRQAELERVYRRHPGVTGARAMRRLLDRTGDRAHSELERIAIALLRAAGISGFEPNYTTILPSGRTVEIDIAFPASRFAIELDGYAYHSDPESLRADLQRANHIMAGGWVVRRFTYSDLLGDPDGFVETVREVLAG